MRCKSRKKPRRQSASRPCPGEPRRLTCPAVAGHDPIDLPVWKTRKIIMAQGRGRGGKAAANGAASGTANVGLTAEGIRLEEARTGTQWRRWGPYVSDRQWGTVREDYSPGGNAWEYFPHEQARSRAYRWGEDGIGAVGDEHLFLCLGVALWNGNDPILKERLFGLTNSEGNHGEDVKELYYYVDSTPTHSYMRMLYKYPHAAFPYSRLVEENRRRGQLDSEFELIDTGVFDDNRYFDVEIAYAKGAPADILCEITVTNRGPDAASLHVLPQLWARNIWSWQAECVKPQLAMHGDGSVTAAHPNVGV